MVKIRPLGPNELKQVLHLLQQFGDNEFSYAALEHLQSLFLPFHQMSHWLPLRLTFMPGIYVAVEQHHVLGLVWVSQDGGNPQRWKIDQLILNPQDMSSLGRSALDVGRQLIDYVITSYGAKGVETFLAYVDTHYDQGLALLKECGFRHCTKVTTYHYEGAMSEGMAPMIKAHSHNPLLREVKAQDRPKLTELYAESLPPEVRVSLRKTGDDLFPSGFQRCSWSLGSGLYRHWVVGEPEKVYLMGSVAIHSKDYKHYQIRLIVSPGWQDGLEGLLAIALRHIYHTTSHPVIQIEVYEFHHPIQQALSSLGFQTALTTQVLVKDYWVSTSKDPELLQNPVLFLANKGRTSPAWQKCLIAHPD